jgi:hypothetical protein
VSKLKYPTIVCNLGLGDLIVLSGAIVHLAGIHGGLRVPVLDYNLSNADAIFFNHPEIELFVVTGDRELRDSYKNDPDALPCYWTRVEGVIVNPDISWDVWMYQQLGVDFNHRYSSNPIENAALKFSQIQLKEPYYLVHDDQERDFNITYPPWHPFVRTYRIHRSGNLPILCWVEAIRRAKELHFMDSCCWHLAESMNLFREQDKYIHLYCRVHKDVWHDVHTRYYWQSLGTRKEI